MQADVVVSAVKKAERKYSIIRINIDSAKSGGITNK